MNDKQFKKFLAKCQEMWDNGEICELVSLLNKTADKIEEEGNK